MASLPVDVHATIEQQSGVCVRPFGEEQTTLFSYINKNYFLYPKISFVIKIDSRAHKHN